MRDPRRSTSKPRRANVKAVCAATLLVLPVVWPVLMGANFYLRDVGTTHRPAWALVSELGLSKVDPAASFGQPYRGNPNLLLFYPTPKFARSVEAHLVLHLALLAWGMAVWLGRQCSTYASIAGALCFALSGYVLSASSSMNALTTIAWIPWVLLVATNLNNRPLFAALRVVTLAFFSIAGEPVLILGTLTLALALASRAGGRAAVTRFLLAGIVALVVAAPIHRETLLAALDSHRVVRGYPFVEAAESLHPARLVELIVPGFFGTPSRIGAGSWWGYGVSRGMRPYVSSFFIGIIPLALVTCYGVLTRWRASRAWWALLVLCASVAASGGFPGAAALWDALPFLHVIRFPVKAFLFATLALSVLTSRAWDHLCMLPSSGVERRRIAQYLGGIIALIIPSMLLADRLVLGAFRRWWDPAWLAPSEAFVHWTTTLLKTRLLFAAAMLMLLLFWTARRRGTAFHVVVIAVVVIDLTTHGRDIVPTSAKHFARSLPSPVVQAALRANGRVFERAYKDLDVPIFGLLGRYPDNNAENLAIAQSRQAWALTGAMYGLRYAYDRSPDGSYTWRNHLLQTRLEQAPWDVRVKWLRAAAVATIIASQLPEPYVGLRPLARETSIGIPVTLYGIEPRLEELRAAPSVRWVRTPEEAMRVFEDADFDETREIVVEGSPAAVGNANVTMLRDEPDRIAFRSMANGPAIVFLARSYTRSTRARASGSELRVMPANVHLCAIQVPPGAHTVTVSF